MITITFWACLVSSGVCTEKTHDVHADNVLACLGLAPQNGAREWLDEHPAYRLRVDGDHPIQCSMRRELAA